MFKIGFGYDVHCLVPERKLILGGVAIDYHLGLAGHSDADVLTHAVMDALLGAAGQGDIGQHFPDSDQKYKDVNSLLLLDQVMHIIKQSKLKVSNVDTVIVAQHPKLAPYRHQMETNLAQIIQAPVNVKATTTEGLGFTGRGEGIAAYATVLLYAE
ncbi:MAG: 2-C-methyl-D-erythritol 2,4-cyclodiphosphate synthase [Candidatus Schekmanbacteria bacterium]|nr:2-C-methyl-D-erythritol 2,4-cyclodiphosphate synthase [Candidatus Schekmanbacteria bacterium]